MIKASMIYVNWNSSKLLIDSLNSISFDDLSFDYEIIIVDNNSDNFNLDYDFGDAQNKIILSKDNLGFAGANNLAYKKSSGNLIILLNPDTILSAEVLNELVDFIIENPQTAAVGPELVDADGIREMSVYPAVTLTSEIFRLFKLDRFKPLSVYDLRQMDKTRPHSVGSIQGACMVIRRDALETDQIFDDSFFMYSEETDLCHSLRMNNYEITWLPYLCIIHLGGESTKLVEDRMFIELYISKYKFIRKWYGGIAGAIYKTALATGSLARLIILPFTWLFSADIDKRERFSNLWIKYAKLLKNILMPKLSVQ